MAIALTLLAVALWLGAIASARRILKKRPPAWTESDNGSTGGRGFDVLPPKPDSAPPPPRPACEQAPSARPP